MVIFVTVNTETKTEAVSPCPALPNLFLVSKLNIIESFSDNKSSNKICLYCLCYVE